jgi:hypothetical protein
MVWASCGAWRYPDAPVLMRGQVDLRDKLLLHGCDRENWTYLAGGGKREASASSSYRGKTVNQEHSHVV